MSSRATPPATPLSEVARRAIPLIDLTDLADDHGEEGIDALCRRARDAGTAAVCVWPEFVARCASLLADADVRVATVVNFPSGEESVDHVVDVTTAALAAGADEIDVVLPFRAFAAGRSDEAARMVERVRTCVESPALLKVILETGELPAEQVRPAARLAIGCGADFVKTSTGKSPVGATPRAARAMLEVIAGSGRQVGLKASGGIRTAGDAGEYLTLADEVMGAGWVSPTTFRFGASGLLDALLDELPELAGGDRGPASSTY